MGTLEKVHSLAFCSLGLPLSWFALLLLLLLLPLLTAEPAFPNFHFVIEISSFLGNYQSPSTRLDYRHPTLWTEWLLVVIPFLKGLFWNYSNYYGTQPQGPNSRVSASGAWFGCCYYFKACLIDSPWGNANQTLEPPWLITCEAVSHTWHRNFHLIIHVFWGKGNGTYTALGIKSFSCLILIEKAEMNHKESNISRGGGKAAVELLAALIAT